MTGFLTTYGANGVLSSIPMPSTLYAKGHLGNPGPDALLLPAAETRRISVAFGTPVGGIVDNAGLGSIASATATEDWDHVSLWDAASGGNPWWIVPFPIPQSITLGETIRIPIGVLVLSFTLWS